ncbi:MAG: hypothetical protein ACYTHJ_04040 [Planctomycetota bacterium]|jgi:hypothetical protein
MKETELEQMACDEVRRAIAGNVEGARIVHCEAEAAWDSAEFRTRSDHRLHVLAPGPDIVLFYDDDDEFQGWRDEGRKGAGIAHAIDPELLRQIVINELDLSQDAQLGEAIPSELPPLGWTHEALLYTSPLRQAESAIRAWVDPGSFKIIQCIYGKMAEGVPA